MNANERQRTPIDANERQRTPIDANEHQWVSVNVAITKLLFDG